MRVPRANYDQWDMLAMPNAADTQGATTAPVDAANDDAQTPAIVAAE